MKKSTLLFGLLAGGLVTAMMLYSSILCYSNPEFESNDFLGYTFLIAAFSFVFVGIKRYRDKHGNGSISFGKAFTTGLYITLIATGMYLGVWLVEYYVFMPDFLNNYTLHVLHMERIGGASEAELTLKASEMAEFAEMYKNPLFVVITTVLEVFPIGLVISLVSATILRRKPQAGE